METISYNNMENVDFEPDKISMGNIVSFHMKKNPVKYLCNKNF